MIKFRVTELYATNPPWTVSLIVDKEWNESFLGLKKRLQYIIEILKDNDNVRIRAIAFVSIAFDFKDKKDATLFKLKWGGC